MRTPPKHLHCRGTLTGHAKQHRQMPESQCQRSGSFQIISTVSRLISAIACHRLFPAPTSRLLNSKVTMTPTTPTTPAMHAGYLDLSLALRKPSARPNGKADRPLPHKRQLGCTLLPAMGTARHACTLHWLKIFCPWMWSTSRAGGSAVSTHTAMMGLFCAVDSSIDCAVARRCRLVSATCSISWGSTPERGIGGGKTWCAAV